MNPLPWKHPERAERLHALLGVGPFFVAHHIPLINVRYRGQPAQLDHSSAYVQAGAVMLELVQQNGEYPSPFRDMYAPGESGIHHAGRPSHRHESGDGRRARLYRRRLRAASRESGSLQCC